MRNKNLVILTIVVAAFAAYILLFDRHRPTTEEVAAKEDRALPGLDRENVQSVELTSETGYVRLDKHGDTWRLIEPIDFPADSAQVDSLLGSLESLDVDRRLSVDEIDLAEYGLTSPSLLVAITDNDDERTEISIGEELPLGSNRAINLGSDEVFIVQGYFAANVSKPVDKWRSTSLVTLTPGEIASFDLVTNYGHVHAVQVDDEWSLLQPVEDLGDPEQFRNVISDLNAVEIVDFVDDPGADSSMGFDQPRYQITVLPGAHKEPIVLEFGATRQVEDKTQVACRRNATQTFWVTDRAETGLGKAPVRWRSQMIFPFDSWNCDGIAVATDGGQVDIERIEGIWRFADGSEANNSEVLSRLSKLSQMRAIDFDLVAMSPGELGRVTLTLKTAQESADGEPTVLTFLRPMAEGGNVCLTVSGRDTVMSVDPADAAAILEDLDALSPAPVPEQPQEDIEGSPTG
ncbi:MAG: DUF4340 domain-containing protein [bacterium]|nr:DUF4340 domain-containing protein [bacterium]